MRVYKGNDLQCMYSCLTGIAERDKTIKINYSRINKLGFYEASDLRAALGALFLPRIIKLLNHGFSFHQFTVIVLKRDNANLITEIDFEFKKTKTSSIVSVRWWQFWSRFQHKKKKDHIAI